MPVATALMDMTGTLFWQRLMDRKTQERSTANLLTVIAFASSAIFLGDMIWLYYSFADK